MANDKKFIVKNGLTTQNIAFVDNIGGANNTINVTMLSGDTLSFSGDTGQLFSITDSQTGTIFAVNDISGVPSIEVDDDGTIRFAETFGNVLIGTAIDDGVNKLQVAGNIAVTGTVDGRDIAADGTKLDGIETGATADQTAAEILTAIKTVDGAASGLDADLLDGQHGSYYLDWTNVTNKPDPVITLAGDLSGSVTLTDLASGTLTATIVANSVALGTDTTGNYVADVTAGSYITKSGTAGEGWSPTIAVDATSTNTASKVVARDASGNFSAGTITAALSGNATTATTLQTARTLTIGNTGKSFNGSANVSWTLDELAAEYRIPINSIRNNLGDPTVREMALFHGQFNNKFRFIAPTLQEESTDGTTWTTSTRATAAQLGDLMIGEGQGTGITAIPSATVGTYGGYRLTWSVVGTVGYIFLNNLYFYNSTNGNTVSVLIEAYHNTNGWTTITGPHNFSNWPGHTSVPHSSIPYSNSTSQYSQVRVTFSTTHPTNTNSFTLNAIEWFGGYPQGKRNVETYDRDRNVTFPANVTGSSFIGPLTGNATTATTLQTARTIWGQSFNGSANIAGDIVGANNVNITASNGLGIKFWSNDAYKIWMSSAADATWGGRVSGETTSDYNMYFRIGGGTNRGFVFESAYATKLLSINPNGVWTPLTINAATFNATSTTGGGFQGIDADTAAIPSFTWTSDQNTGIWHAGTDQIGFTTGGTNRLTLSTTALTSTVGVTAPTFTGSLSGNASTATTLQTARTIALSGDVTGSASFNGSANITITATVADDSHVHSYLVERSNITYGASYLQWTDLSGQTGTGENGSTPQNPTNDWYHHIIANHGNGAGYYYDLALPFHQDELWFRRVAAGVQGTFRKVWHDGNDGAGSGLDADLLDGQHGSYYQNASNLNAGTVPDARISGSYTGMTNLTGSGTVDFAKFLGNAADSASAPSFSWTGDTNTGIYQPAADQVGITCGGTNELTITTTTATFAGDVVSNSDIRLKKDIEKIDFALSKVKALNGVNFTKIKNGDRSTGLIAQDVQAVLPEAVTADDNGYLSVAYGNMVGLLVEAIKEQDDTINSLKTEVDELKSLVRQLLENK